MQLSVFETLQDVDYSDKKVMIGLSGGINSAAAAIYLAIHVEEKPKDLYCYYAHLAEHSPDTKKFVLDLVDWLKPYFRNVIFETSDNSMNEYCKTGFKGIPHPMRSPCTKYLKLLHMTEFMAKHEIDIDIVGYVRGEYSRMKRQLDRGVKNKDYLIRHLSDEDCFSLVESHLGWIPEIYNIKWTDKRIWTALQQHGHELHPKQKQIIEKYHRQGYNNRAKSYRVFKHNNCLLCKNMHQWEIFMVRVFYPDYYNRAMQTAKELDSYWGRSNEETDNLSDCAICSV